MKELVLQAEQSSSNKNETVPETTPEVEPEVVPDVETGSEEDTTVE